MEPLFSHPFGRNWQPESVLLLAYGAPLSVAEVPAFVRHVRGGRETAVDQLRETAQRYEQIGGRSPLHDITNNTAHRLQKALGKPVYVGMRHSQPFIHETLAQMADSGVRSCVAICLAPHHSSMSIGAYHNVLTTALQDLNYELQYAFVQSWHNHPLLIRLWTNALQRTLNAAGLSADQLDNSHRILFTAHSLPERILIKKDHYPHQLQKTAQLVALHTKLIPSSWELIFQSAPPSPEPWLGPQIEDRLPQLAKSGIKTVFVAPIGFVSEHLEVLYDLDILAHSIATDNDMQLHRTTMPNDTDDLIAVLQGLVRGICRQI